MDSWRGERVVTDDEVVFYDEHGWVFLPGLIPEETAKELLRRAEAIHAREQALKATAEMDRKHGGMDHAVIMPMPSKIDALAAELAISARAGENAQRLNGRPVPVRAWANFFMYKAPAATGGEGAQETIWHQDDPMSPRDRSGHLIFWMSLVESTPEMGTMRFISGSHRRGSCGNIALKSADGDFEGNHLFKLHPRLAGHEISPPLTYRPGDATVHSGLTLHSAPRNRTDRPRWAFLRAFIPADTLYVGSGLLSDARDPRELGLQPHQPFAHPEFPIVYP